MNSTFLHGGNPARAPQALPEYLGDHFSLSLAGLTAVKTKKANPLQPKSPAAAWRFVAKKT